MAFPKVNKNIVERNLIKFHHAIVTLVNDTWQSFSISSDPFACVDIVALLLPSVCSAEQKYANYYHWYMIWAIRLRPTTSHKKVSEKKWKCLGILFFFSLFFLCSHSTHLFLICLIQMRLTSRMLSCLKRFSTFLFSNQPKQTTWKLENWISVSLFPLFLSYSLAVPFFMPCYTHIIKFSREGANRR
jgi:hypothetical protein